METLRETRGRPSAARSTHPQVLRRGPRAAVVEVHEVGARVGPQHVAAVAVAVQADPPHLPCALVAAARALQRERRRALPRLEEIGGDEAAREQPFTRLNAIAFDIECRTLPESLYRADCVDAADEAPDPFERYCVLELGCPAAATRKDGEAETLERVQRGAADGERRDYRNLAVRELPGKLVFLLDLRVAPARRAIELRHQRRLLLHPRLVDAVLVAVEGEQPPVGPQPDACERVERPVGRQSGVRSGLHPLIVDA